MREALQALLVYAVAQGEIRPLHLAIAPDAMLAPFAIDLYSTSATSSG